MFIYKEDIEYLACETVFFNSNNIAGLHMIEIIPKSRSKGIGKSMTENLVMEAKGNNAKMCVLHDSLMGELIYTKLGFNPYGEIETYILLK